MSKFDISILKKSSIDLKFIKIGEIVCYEQPTKYIVRDTNYDNSFTVPVLTAGQTFILGYTNETDNIYHASKENPVIIFDDFTGAFKWVDFPFKVKSSAMKILTTNRNYANIRYIYHLMGKIGYSSVEHKRLWISFYSQIQIGIPSHDVQKEIVEILDNFTELIVKLTSELTARKQQYEYYRDNLLEFEKTATRRFGDIAKISRGASPRPIQNFITQDENGVSWIKIGDVLPNSKYITKTNERITLEGAKKSKFVKIGDFVLSNSMSFGRPYIMKIDGCIHDGWLSISDFENIYTTDFLYHLISSNKIQNMMSQKASNGTVQNLNAEIVKSLELPVPSLDKQQRIVDILDKFDKLVNDISEGIPAEIAARQKQYEYYRDKLLTFKEVGNESI